MTKAVIFDMDGTMVDTHYLWKEVNEELSAQYGKVFNPEVRLQMMGRKEAHAMQIYRDYYHLDVPLEELTQARQKLLFEKLDKVTPIKGLYELIKLLNTLKIKKAIATSSTREFATKVVDMIGLTEEFGVFITGDDVTHSKPDPEIFLLAANRLGVAPKECLVIEDAQNGVEAGYNAHMKVIAIPHDHSSHHDFSKATKVLTSMLEIDEHMIKTI